MPSKYFLPHKEDLEFTTLDGRFPCDYCDDEQMSAKWFKSADRLVWVCPNGHGNSVKASDYV